VELQLCACKTGFDNAPLATDPLDGVAEFSPEMRELEATPMAQLDPLEMCPEARDRVQLRGVGWQPLDLEPLSRAIREAFLDAMTAVHRRPIPEEPQAAGHLAPQVLQQGDHITGIDGLGLAMKIPLALRRNGADGREVIPRPPRPENGRMAYRGIGADDTGPGIAPGFIDEEDRLPLGLGPLLSAGQLSSRP
jgi:hypothetical protein